MGLEDLKKIYDDKEAKTVAESKHNEMLNSQKVVSDTILAATTSLIRYMEGHITRTELTNQLEDYATSTDIGNIASKLDKLDKSVLDGKTDITPLLVGLNAVKEQIKEIPETKFEQKDSVSVKNLSEIKFDTKALENAINALDLKVDVKAPIINTEKTDTKLVESILSDIFKAVSKKQEVIKELKVSNLKEIELDTSTIEKEQKKQTKLLKDIVDKPVSRGGGGGGIVSFVSQAGLAMPVTQTASGRVPVALDMATEGIATEATLAKLNEFEIPVFDTQVIDESASPATTTITYKKSGATVATKTITVVGTTTTISVV